MSRKAAGRPETKDAIWQYFVQVIRENMHIILAFSPIGEGFRARCRQFPSIINCASIDWCSGGDYVMHAAGACGAAEPQPKGSSRDSSRRGSRPSRSLWVLSRSAHSSQPLSPELSEPLSGSPERRPSHAMVRRAAHVVRFVRDAR